VLILGYQLFYYAPRMREAQERQRLEETRRQEVADSLAALERPKQPAVEPSEAPETAQEEPVAQRDSLTTGVAATAAGLPTATRGDADFVTVDTPLSRVTFSTVGGDIVSTQLHEYLTAGQPVELFAWNKDMPDGIGAIALVGDERRMSLANVRFEARGEGRGSIGAGTVVRVDESNPEFTLSFVAEDASGGRVTRSYEFRADTYVVKSTVTVTGTQYRFMRGIEWDFGPGMTSTEQDQRDDFAQMRALVRLGDELHKKKPADFTENYSGNLQWVALKMRYFTTTLIPEEPVPGASVHVQGVKEANLMTARTFMPAAPRGGSYQQAVDVYMGPLDYQRLREKDRDLEKLVDIGFDHFKIFRPVSAAILWTMVKLHQVIPNYGWVIILISVFTKVLFYRLTHKSFKSMKQMHDMQPKLQALKEKYKDDRQKLSEETMKAYKEGGVNPLGGCLPMLLQMPVFIALFSVLRNTIEVRQAPWILWIHDLSQQDVLFHMPFSLPLIGSAFSVLPLLMGISMLMQSKIGGGIAGPSSGATQPAGFTYMLPIVFTFLFYKMPSGLVIYWIINTVLSIAQQWYINKGSDEDEDETPGKSNTTSGRGKGKARPKAVKPTG